MSKRENWQNRYFTIVDGPQPHIAWYKDQKVCRILCLANVFMVAHLYLCERATVGANALLLTSGLQWPQDFQSGKSVQGTMPLGRATARVVLGVDSSSLLPRQFEVETPERNLIAKTLEGQDATVRYTTLQALQQKTGTCCTFYVCFALSCFAWLPYPTALGQLDQRRGRRGAQEDTRWLSR